MTRLQAGDPAPELGIPDADGKVWTLDELRGRKAVIYFYPKDDTPGCTAEACDFRDARDDLAERDYVVPGASPQGAEWHRRFSAKHGLNFPLLVDADHAVAERYGAWGEKTSYGRTSFGIIRSAFAVDEDGRIEHAEYNVKGRGHVERLLGSLAGRT